jgi:hypothetical protein
MKDKLTKLASQFDRELLERDKSFKVYQTAVWGDVQQMFD